ncbi:derlin-1-like [Macrosteles quadrilineatus]|uniref:derlin-1-like n=1 Tax=Macrosteles quadrilineatus TaxID=74068 RepID=UPI0023E13D4F|nr:derlin-1-like [Macrosteles quadrilineatus]XP_054289286.1 derlin-1-like [Macrosteles quadrilineatus]
MSELSDWFNSVPIFTRWWLSLTAGLSLLGRFKLLNAYHLILAYEPLIHRFQIWRPFTALFFYPISSATGFHFLINCYFLYNYSMRLETGQYAGRSADYLFMLLFNWLACVIIGLVAEIPLLMDSMVLSVLYVWCQLNKDVIVNFWFGTSFKAMYLPFVLFAFNLIISGGGMMELVGIVVGHVYFFLKYKYPQELGGQEFITTPSILYHYFPNERVMGGFGAVPTRRAGGDPPPRPGGGGGWGGYNWGRGNVLGDR